MRHSVRDLPVVSAEPVDLQKHSLVQGKAVYFLVKVHGRSCDSITLNFGFKSNYFKFLI